MSLEVTVLGHLVFCHDYRDWIFMPELILEYFLKKSIKTGPELVIGL